MLLDYLRFALLTAMPFVLQAPFLTDQEDFAYQTTFIITTVLLCKGFQASSEFARLAPLVTERFPHKA